MTENLENTADAAMPNSNAVWLTPRQWLVAALGLLALFVSAPMLWKQVETFRPGPDYRVPYALGSDYWLYARHCRAACRQGKIPVIGDSVIWGHYVRPDQTLSHCLNDAMGENRFANLGLDGTHPAALGGLIEYYARAVSGRPVVLQFNPLWMSSAKHDLQTTKEFHFNHPRLVPQFATEIPCYKAPFSARLGIVMERHIPFLSWTSHLRIAYLQGMDLPAWTLENPYGNPLAALARPLPEPQNVEAEKGGPWLSGGSQKRDMAWVDLDSSLQWLFFRRAVERLRARGNRVFVLVGPFNEHMLTAENATAFGTIKTQIERWLARNGVPHLVAAPLASDLYADSSHPLAEGYVLLSKQLMNDPAFQTTVLDRRQ
ncbi:MAG TPA: hypothetical protein P5068_14020 [Sedimentisphaerales bacterium]|nr:hypothetical protein [Sedimentisphaerales bacterium]HRV48877.1 hypothetical protein [Sedimentisphaerales bacterium]